MSDKRSVHTDALRTLGTILDPTDTGNQRDAIHIAVEPVTAVRKLWPGQRIALRTNGQAYIPTDPDHVTGIVDPFLTEAIMPGEKFWFLVLPRTITSLRHVWSHPSFPEK
jgi:hypothetical protein